MFRVVVAAAAVVVAAGCASEQAEPSGGEASSGPWPITVTATTTSGLVAQNYDDEHCVWPSPSFVLRDGDGSVVAEGEAKSLEEGTAEVEGEPAQLGRVVSEPPDYECELRFKVEPSREADFYEIEVTVGEASGSAVSEAGEQMSVEVG